MKKKNSRHLQQQDRDRIDALFNNGIKQKEIAKILRVDKSTISREIQRNRRKIRKPGGTANGRYEATVAQHKAYMKRKYAKYQGKKINENKKLREYIKEKLGKYWSPDEISGRMKEDKEPFYASKTAIYEWLYTSYSVNLCSFLYSKRYRAKKRKPKTKRTLVPNRKGLLLRPSGANNKTRFGHYEGDTVVSGKKTGSKTALAVLYERKAKLANFKKINNLKPRVFNQAIKKMINDKKVKSLTMDNGIENTKHEELGLATFFCDPYSSWQKGGVENIIKMARRFFIKGGDLSQYSDEYIMTVENILNNKPRKSLNYQTPLEVMAKNNLIKKVEQKTNIFVTKKTQEKVALR
ncbi:MAG: IS30 family transposase, partial [Patescibacteria group bacterium]